MLMLDFGGSISFCDWGSSALNKLRLFRTERLVAELDWFAQMDAKCVYCADANFGILERDMLFCEHMVAARERLGAPRLFVTNYAKNSNERVFQIAKQLHDAGMLFGTTLSMQSVDADVLKNIKRSSIGTKRYRELKTRYNEARIPTYTELILGLPTETKDGFIRGISKLVDDGHDDIRTYWLGILPNAPMNEPAQIESYGIKTVERVLSDAASGEKNDIVISTKAMPFDDWIETNIFATVIIRTLHVGGYTKFLARFLSKERGIDALSFYTAILNRAKRHPTSLLGSVVSSYDESLRLAISENRASILAHALETREDVQRIAARYPTARPGGRFGDRDANAFLWLWINDQIQVFYEELAAVLTELQVPVKSDRVLQDLMRFSREMMVTIDYDPDVGKTCQYEYDWNAYFFGDGHLSERPIAITYTDTAMGVLRLPLKRGSADHLAMSVLGLDAHGRYHHTPERMKVVPLDAGTPLAEEAATLLKAKARLRLAP